MKILHAKELQVHSLIIFALKDRLFRFFCTVGDALVAIFGSILINVKSVSSAVLVFLLSTIKLLSIVCTRWQDATILCVNQNEDFTVAPPERGLPTADDTTSQVDTIGISSGHDTFNSADPWRDDGRKSDDEWRPLGAGGFPR